MDEFMSAHPEWFPVFFIGMWVAITSILGAVSGWYALMERYPAREEAPLLTLKNQSGSMRGVKLNGVLTLSVSQSGLRVGMIRVFGIRLFGLFQRDFLVPWHELTVVRKDGFFGSVARIEFGKPAQGNLTVSADIVDRLARAAGRNWPEAAPPPALDRSRIARELFRQWLGLTTVAALFFTVVPRLSSPQDDSPPLAVAILFPAIVIGLAMLSEYFRRTRS